MHALSLRVFELEYRMSRFEEAVAAVTLRTRIQLALAASVLLHLFVIFGIGFVVPDLKPPPDRSPPLQVVLVNAKTPEAPKKAEVLAQANLAGGGNTDSERHAKSPLPATRVMKPAPDPGAAARRVAELEREAKKLLTRVKPAPKAPAVAPAPKAEPKPTVKPAPQPAPKLPSAADLIERSREIARLQAQISREWESYEKRPRRTFVGARAKEYRFARYIDDWRLKIERIGELNYPQAAHDQRLYGRLVVTVSIRKDGSLDAVEVNRSSGHKILDAAALRIVRMAAPFAPFPPDIAKDTDILSITRTWTFTRSDRLVTE